MTILTIRAIYEHGILRPVEPLNLPESTTVEIAVRTTESSVLNRRGHVHAILQAAGLMLLEDEPLPTNIPSPERQRELAVLFALPTSIADTLLADREERW